METIKEALIIESNGLRTNCFVVENLPKRLVYQKTKKLMPMDEYSERMVPAFTIDENGKRHATGELEDTLLPGIELDGAGSGAFIFQLGNDDSEVRLAAIDEHIKKNVNDPALRFERIPYAQQPGVPSSAPKAYSQIPKVRLPEPASPPATPVVEQAQVAPSFKPRRAMTEEAKAKLRDNLAKARAKKAATQVQA